MPPSSSDSQPTPALCLEWGRGLRTPFPEASTLPEIFARWVRESPDAPAVRENDAVYSYRQLADLAAQAASTLRATALPPSSFIALPACRSIGFVAAALGTLEAGHA